MRAARMYAALSSSAAAGGHDDVLAGVAAGAPVVGPARACARLLVSVCMLGTLACVFSSMCRTGVRHDASHETCRVSCVRVLYFARRDGVVRAVRCVR